MIDDQTIMKICLAAGDDLEKGVADLVDQANKNGGVDNINTLPKTLVQRL